MKRETQLGLTYPSSLIVSGSFNAGIVHLYSSTDYLDTASSMSVILMCGLVFKINILIIPPPTQHMLTKITKLMQIH